MSTVFITLAHIASDHTVVETGHPHHTKVDPNHRKLFLSPDHRFVIGTVGKYDPVKIDTPIVYDAVEKMLQQMIDSFMETGKSSRSFEDEDESASIYKKIFDPQGRTLLVTRDHRFIVYHSENTGLISSMVSADLNGIGSGGFLAIGLLAGGRTVKNIWSDLNRLDETTSREHTVIALSVLKPWKRKS